MKRITSKLGISILSMLLFAAAGTMLFATVNTEWLDGFTYSSDSSSGRSVEVTPVLPLAAGCADFLANLNCVGGGCPDPTLEFVPPNQADAYPSPILPTEQVSPLFFGGGQFRGTDESFMVVVGGDFTVPSTGGTETEGRVAIGGNLIVDKFYAMSESGGGTYVIGAPGDAVSVVGTVSGVGPLGLGANNPGNTYNLVSGGSNTTPMNNGNKVENSATFPVEVSELLTQATCASAGMRDAMATGTAVFEFGSGTLTGTNAAVEVFNVDGTNLNPGFQGTANFSNIAAGATIVINVSGATVDLGYQLNAGRLNDPNSTGDMDALVYNVVWNFYEATDITLTATTNGMVIAPLANLDVVGNLNGRAYIGGNLTHSGSGTEIHNYPFTGDLSSFCPSVPIDPTGYFYCVETGEIIPGGSIAVTPPVGGMIINFDNGADGSYAFDVVGDGTYTIVVAAPPGYTFDMSTQQGMPFDPTGMIPPVNIGSGSTGGTNLDDFTAASNPFYNQITFETGDPDVFLNNIALTGCSILSVDECSNLTNPLIATTCIVQGDPQDASANTQDAVVRFDNNATGSLSIGDFGSVGSTWALAYDFNSDQLYTASALRRHIGLGPGGLGAIYATPSAAGASGATSVFYDLATHVSVGTVPDNTTRGLGAITDPSYDPAVFDLVGKAGLGDIDISDDGAQLYVVNLFDKLVYLINTATPATAPTALPAYPDPGCTAGESRPWALKLHNGRLYLGVICSAENAGGTAANLNAFVYAYDGNVWSEVLSFPLDYPRQNVYPGLTGLWSPWADDFSDLGASSFFSHPTPIFSDIEFLDDGSMVLGFLDRTTFQIGYDNYSTDDTTPDTDLYSAVSGGDILRAAADGDGTFTIESNAAGAGFGPSSGAGTGAGPDNGEFYFADRLLKPGEEHRETALGGLAVLPGSGEVLVSVIDPLIDPVASSDNLETGGVSWLNNSTGDLVRAIRLYSGRGFDGFLGKGGGIGDIELLCGQACEITIVAATPSACDVMTGEYTLDVEVTYSNEQVGGLALSTNNGASQTFFTNGTGMETFTLTGLASDGMPNIDVTATWDNDNSCTVTSPAAYSAPESCGSSTPSDILAFAIQASCNSDGSINSDGYLQLSAVTGGLSYEVNIGSTYDGTGTRTTLLGASYPLQIETGLANPATDQDYTIRVFAEDVGGANDPFTDVVVTLNVQDCMVGCDCTEMVYLNDDLASLVHKFSLSSTGALTEIGNPWLAANTVNRPHGLAVDLNGNVYVGQASNFGNQGVIGPIFQLSCEGDILDNDRINLLDDTYGFNVGSANGILYTYSNLEDAVQAYSLCTGELIGEMDIDVDIFGWGFYVDETANKWYYPAKFPSTLISGSLDPDLYTIPASNSGAEEFPLAIPAGGARAMGVTRDSDGNFYIVFNTLTGDASTVFIQKYNSSGMLLASISDNTAGFNTGNGEQGFWGARGITYSATTNLLYVGNYNNCVTVFDTDLVEQVALNVGNPDDSEPKGISIATECCPVNNNTVINELICFTGVDEIVFLQDLIACDGAICEGAWEEITSNPNINFDNCDNSIVVSGTGCSTFVLESDGTGSNALCGAFRMEVEVCVVEPPTNDTPTSLDGTCTNGVPNSDASITIPNIMNADVVGISSAGAGMYDGSAYDVTAAAADLEVVPGTNEVTFSGLEHDQSYVIRLYNMGDGCFTDVTFSTLELALPDVAFVAPPDLCIDAGVQAGLSGGTPPQGTEAGDLGVYSGTGVTDDGNGMTYSFDPAAAGVGVHTITYTYTAANGCSNSASDDIEVFGLPIVSFTAPDGVCTNAGIQSGLSGGLPEGGVYSGPGVTDDGNGMTYSFDPAVAGEGTQTITYTYTDANTCTNSTTDDVEVCGSDYGDLPDSYGTTNTNSGPSHGITDQLYLGACVDSETDGQDEPMAGIMTGGDDNTIGDSTTGTCTGDDDEDGIVFVTPLIPDGQACIQVTAVNETGTDAVLQGWIDFDGDGTFIAAEELQGLDFGTGGATIADGGVTDAIICFDVPIGATFTDQGEAFARFRLSSAGGLDTGGEAPDGEVEDYKEKLAKIGSYVWNDANANGLQDEAGAFGLEGAQLILVFTNPNGDDISYTTTTDASGVYSFCGLIVGDYNLSIPTPPTMFSAVTMIGAGGDDEIDSEDPTGVAITITDVMGLPENEDSPTGDNPGGEGFPDMQDDLQYDFGYFMPANIGDYVWEDLNDDGIQDPNEPGLEGVTVTLYLCDGGVKGAELTSITTDGTGFYQFTGLAPDFEYCVEFDVTTSNHPEAGLLSWSPQNTGDGTNDSDVDPADANTAGCTDGYTPAANETYPDFDAGVNVRDYGDLPEGPYATTSPDGPSHSVPANPEVFLGTVVDVETNGQPSPDAEGDGDDEDGVTKPDMIVRGGTADFTVDVVNTSGAAAKVVAFVDWDGDGDFDEAEEMESDIVTSSGSVVLTFDVPTDAVINTDIGVRVRVSTDPNFLADMEATGFAYDGEVEDCLTQVMAFDYGDLADATIGTAEEEYQTTTADMGASHKLAVDDMQNIILKIGNEVDDELDGQPSDDADGDGDDEDGFDPDAQMFVRGVAQDITVPVMNMTGSDAKLTMYVDWNNDGEFGMDEMYFTTVADMAASSTLTGVTPPADAVINDEVGVRFRLTTDTEMSPTGPASDGEVEDYLISIMAFDYGDLADGADGNGEQDYETLAANGGPSHKIITDENDMVTLKIGAEVDDELDGQPSDDADGDDATVEDEDGFDPDVQMFIRNQAQDLTIPVMNITGSDAKLTMYVDWNNDGVFDVDEMYTTTVADMATSATLMGVTPPADATINDDIGVRFRLTTDMAMNAEGPAPDGEVEDYEIVVMAFDYGDLVDGSDGTGEQDYETSTANGGPSHKIITNEDDMVTLKIGADVDDELDGQPSDDADADGDDEDGFDPTQYMFVTGQTQDVTIPVMNMTGGDAKLTIYVDWDNDGDFDLPEEMIFATVADGDTEATLSVTPPTSITTLNDELGFRIRLTTDMVMSPEGPAPDGEVEDYEIMVMGFDYGDLVDGADGTSEQDYETSAANGGPSHKIITNEDDMVLLKIGASADDEADGQPSDDADGDNAADVDDEDGFDPTQYMFVTGQTQDITIPVMNMMGEDAKLTIYIDWDNDGDFDQPEEMIFTTVADGDTEVTLSVTPPTSITTLNDELGFRIRLTTDMAMSAEGLAPDGEVEDYEIMVMGFDYGDLNDVATGTTGDPGAPLTPADHQTTLEDDGAGHKILTNEDDMVILKIGAANEDEADGQPSADAGVTGGDDNTEVDDEDGLDLDNIPLFILTQTTTLDIPVMNMTGEEATLVGYIDYNKDGFLDPATEKYVVSIPDGATSVSLEIGPIPTDAVVGQDVGLRLRLANDMDEVMTSTGVANSGEVEDYMVQIVGFDFGDLPDTYTTTGPDDAPRHIVNEDLKLGACVDVELDGIPEAMAGMMEGGDDADPGLVTFGDCIDGDDEDGIEFTHPLIPGNESCITVTAMNNTGEDAVLQVWIDWNGDGMFNAGEELAFTDNIIPDGGVDGVEYCFPVPDEVGYSDGALFIRARLSPEGGLLADEQLLPVPFGEIEDYKVKLSKVGSLVWEDYNGNGDQDEDASFGLDGVDVELLWYGPDGDVSTTDDNRTYTVQTETVDGVPGVYNFCGLHPGSYSLSVPTLPTDFVPTWSDIPGDDVIDSDDHAGVEFTIVDPMGLPEGEDSTGDNPGGINGFPDMQDDLTFDFGAYIPAELGDFVWLDENFDAADDTQGSTGSVPDTPIPGVTVTLMGTNNIGQSVMLVLVTDENGFYKFTDLAPGSYKVIFDASTALDDCGPILLAVAPDVGDDTLDSDQDQTTFTTPFYDLFSGDDIPTVDGGFVEPEIELGCIANVNVTLGDDCTAVITPEMVLTGLYGCVDELIVTVDGTDSDVISGCGEHTYMVQIIEDGELFSTCWGTLFAEDKTDPVVDCPADTDEVTVAFALQTLEGSIDGTEQTLSLADYTCFTNFFSPFPGAENQYDLITFTVSPDLPATDVYNIQVASDFLGSVIALFQGEFDADNPCENVLGGSDGAYFVDPFFGINAFFAQDFRIEMPLEPGQTYTLMIANDGIGNLGDYVVGIVSDNGGSFSAPFSAPSPVEVSLPLLCEDLSLVELVEPESYMVDANGAIMIGTLSANLRAILDLTGYPDVSDNCGPVLVTVSDVVESAGDCGDITITRTFDVSDRADGVCIGTPRTDECTQIITLTRPTIFDLIMPPYTATIECDEEFPTDGSVGGPDDNPHASVTGYPFLLTASGYMDLNETYCNLGANYSDEPRIDVCEGTYKFRREWNLIDWCSPADNTTWDQFVKVGDYTGPVITGVDEVITISTSPFECVANITIPTPNVEDGNTCGTAAATTYTVLANGASFFAGGNIADGDVVNAPIGTHTLILCAEDDCGNETCEEYTIVVRDEIEPTASCDDDLNVSIGGGDVANGIEGIGRVFAEDVDEGSSDNCGEVTLEVRRNYWRTGTCDPSANRWSPWGEYVDFYCCDIANEITIELRVTDESGNQNICWMTVVPEDKLNPYCFAPEDVELTCNELPLAFPGDIEAAYDEDFEATSLWMNSIFGAATGTDNCAVDTIVERTPNIQINECGWGSITRRFEAWQLKPEGDVNGNGAIDINEVYRSTNSCSQDIIITEVHDFTIDFPEDADADCGDPDVPTVITTTDGCDVLSVNIGEPVVFAATGDECYKYSITYDVINWCLWDGEYEGYVLPRMTEDDGESLPVDRAVEGNERPVVTYDDVNGLCIDRRHSDRDGDSFLPNCDSPTLPNYGRYIYTQFVKVYDSSAPVVTVDPYGGPTANCPDLLAGQFGDDDGDCEEGVSITFSVTDECELFDGDGNLVVSIVSAELDAFAVDANNDGHIKSNEFVADGSVLSNITDNGDGTYEFSGTFPIITTEMGDNILHAVRILFEDGCGNQTSTYIEFDVVDCKGPAPICINGLTVTLMPQEEGGCAMAIWASDFEGSPIYDCTGQGPETNGAGQYRVTKYAIYRAADVEADPNFVPSPEDTGLVLTEADLAEETVVVHVYAFDEEGNYDYCETYVLVQAHVSCGEDTGTIAGVIVTEEDEAVENVEVNLNGVMDNMVVTGIDGTFSFANLPLGGDYSITPYLNTNPLNGVTTFDLVKISKHILNVEVLDSPYKLIAADANRSNTITTLDMIQIRKLILNIITEFPNNTSWRFVDAAHDFTDVTNPWADEFPELINENNLAADVLNADFVGVKIGDVNGSAQANALAGDDRNLNGMFHLQAEDIALRMGNTYTVAITGENLDQIAGFQGTLHLDGAELVDIEYAAATAENFGLRFVDEGYITMSWNRDGIDAINRVAQTESDIVIFSLVIRATDDRILSEVLRVTDRYTTAEAYRGEQTTNVDIHFTQGALTGPVFELYQNSPNPFQAMTLISFNLPKASEATIRIMDAAGQLIHQIKGDYAAGYNTINLSKAMLQGASGVLNYTVEAGDHKATRQMIVVQ